MDLYIMCLLCYAPSWLLPTELGLIPSFATIASIMLCCATGGVLQNGVVMLNKGFLRK